MSGVTIRFMGDFFALVYIFLFNYLSPFLFVIGLMFFIYGCIEYFIVGLGGDEGRAAHGRDLLLRSINWFVVALLVYGIIAFLGWIGTVSNSASGSLSPGIESNNGVNINRSEGLLGVPNTPKGND